MRCLLVECFVISQFYFVALTHTSEMHVSSVGGAVEPAEFAIVIELAERVRRAVLLRLPAGPLQRTAPRDFTRVSLIAAHHSHVHDGLFHFVYLSMFIYCL